MSKLEDATLARDDHHRRWAPWWVYVVAIVVLNQLRQVIIGRDATDWLSVVTAILLAVMVFALVTMIYRLSVVKR